MRISGAVTKVAAADGVENSEFSCEIAQLDLQWLLYGLWLGIPFRFVDDLRRRCRSQSALKTTVWAVGTSSSQREWQVAAR